MSRNLPIKGEFLVYRTDDGRVKLDVRLENETIWLTQQMMADLFQSTKQNIGQHLKNIFADGELEQNSVVKKFFTTAEDGKRYKTNFYNLNEFLKFHERRVLGDAGNVTKDEAAAHAQQEYDHFAERRRERMEQAGETEIIGMLENMVKEIEAEKNTGERHRK